jgi:myo-inositol 2-dehydrogenase / D-chiro-inositol 1-dehydrogenase
MKTGKVRVGVLGVGRIGKIHNLATRIPGAQLAVVGDVVPEELENVAARLGISRTFADYKDVIALADIDAVVICTPTNTHYEIILDAAAAGKHIFCEKPVELSIEKIRRVNQVVHKCGVQLMVGFNRRLTRIFLKCAKWLDPGKSATRRFFTSRAVTQVLPLRIIFALRAESFWIWLFTILIWLAIS